MGLPAILVENYFNTLAFPGHTVTADEQAAGFEVFHLANGRRAPTDRYQAVTANTLHSAKAACDRVRWATGLCLDRGHNLAQNAGVVAVLGSNDGWVTQRTVWSGVLPTATTPNGSLDDPTGVVTEEGAFLVRFAGDGFTQWRLSIPALGAGIVAQVVGAWIGMWIGLPYLKKPWTDGTADIQSIEQQSASGWLGSTVPVSRRAGTINLDTTSLYDEEQIRLHLDGQYLAARRPMWFVPDDQQAERGFLVIRPKALAGLGYESGWGYRVGRYPYQEHGPLRPGG